MYHLAYVNTKSKLLFLKKRYYTFLKCFLKNLEYYPQFKDPTGSFKTLGGVLHIRKILKVTEI